MRPDCTSRRPSVNVNLLHAHGSPTHYLYNHRAPEMRCRCSVCRAEKAEYGAAYIERIRQHAPPRRKAFGVNLLHSHGSPTGYLYAHDGCRCTACSTVAAEYNARYRAAHKDEIADQRASSIARLDYEMTHREERRAICHNRRARLSGNGGAHTSADIRAQLRRQRGKCYWQMTEACRERGGKLGRTYHVDHIVPTTRGGSNGPENLVIACPTCNHNKLAKLPHEWSDRLC